MDNQPQPLFAKKRIELICNIAANSSVFIRASKIALIVGTILNLINQGDMIISANFSQIAWGKLLLTYCIPFLVSIYTAVSVGFEFKIGDPSPVNSSVRCSRCKKSIVELHKGEPIPECPHCGLKTKWKLYKSKE